MVLETACQYLRKQASILHNEGAPEGYPILENIQKEDKPVSLKFAKILGDDFIGTKL